MRYSLRPKPHRQQQQQQPPPSQTPKPPPLISPLRSPRLEMSEPRTSDETGAAYTSSRGAAVKKKKRLEHAHSPPVVVPNYQPSKPENSESTRDALSLPSPRPNPTESTSDVPPANPSIPADDIRFSPPRGNAHLGGNYVPRTRVFTRPFITCLIFGLFVIGAVLSGRPVFLRYITDKTTEPISLWEPMDHIHHELGKSVFPLYLDLQLDRPIPADTYGILGTLCDEINTVAMGKRYIKDTNNKSLALASYDSLYDASYGAKLDFEQLVWQEKDIIGPQALLELDHRINSWDRDSRNVRHPETERTHVTMQTIKTWMKDIKHDYKKGRFLMNSISRHFNTIDQEIGPFLDMIISSLTPLPELYLRGELPEVLDVLDSAEYLRRHLVPVIREIVRPMIWRAESTLDGVCNIISAEIGRYEELQWTMGMEERTELRRGAWLWFLEERTTRTQYVLDPQIYLEMGKLAEMPWQMSLAIFRWKNLPKDVRRQRPLRPSERFPRVFE